MKFSVVIVNYASWPLTLRCVESLRGAEYQDFEIVVVNNDREKLPALPEDVRLVQNRENTGFARACNQGVAVSTGEHIVFINPDTLVQRHFFASLETFFERAPGVGLLGPRIVDGAGHLQLSARREISLVSGLLGRTSLLTRFFPKSSIVRDQFPAVTATSGPTTVDWVSGACMVVRRKVLEGIGGFDERFFMYFEDADLCRRVRGAGWLVYYVPDVEVVHQTGGSSKSRPKAIWLLHKSAFLYHRKHGAHGPLSLYSAAVLGGLAVRASAKLAVSLVRNCLKRLMNEPTA